MSATEEALARMSNLAQRLVELTMRLKAVRMGRLGARDDVQDKVPASPALTSCDKLA